MAKTKAELMAEKMAEKRVAQEAFEAGKTPVVEITEQETTQKPEKTAQEPQKEVKPTANTPKPKKPVQANSEHSAGILQMIAKKPKKEKKSSFSLYLSETNMEKLEEAVKKTGMRSKSEFIDQLLTEIFK